MDRQSMQQLGGGGAATQEWLHPGATGGGGAQVADGTFLMELLEDAPATEQPPQEDVDQLRRVIQSLEAEIDASSPANGASKTAAEQVSSDDVDDGALLDDMLSDLDCSPGPCVVADEALPPFEYWTEVPPAVTGHDMGGWYLDGDGVMVGGYEFRAEQCSYGYGESLGVDQVYSPLWE